MDNFMYTEEELSKMVLSDEELLNLVMVVVDIKDDEPMMIINPEIIKMLLATVYALKIEISILELGTSMRTSIISKN